MNLSSSRKGHYFVQLSPPLMGANYTGHWKRWALKIEALKWTQAKLMYTKGSAPSQKTWEEISTYFLLSF
jgi:hypothetical protein